MNKIRDIASGATNGIGAQLSAIGNAIKGYADDAETMANCKEAAELYAVCYKEATGKRKDIEIKVDHDNDWDSRVVEFMKKAAVKSFGLRNTLQFLRDDYKRKIWENGCDKVVLTYQDKPSDDELEYIDEHSWARVSREDDVVYIKFYNRCVGYSYIYIRDEIEFGLNMDMLTGKCWYKSGWVKDFPEPKFPFGTDNLPRWFQCRHYCLLWYPRRMWGWNWKANQAPEGEDMSLWDKLPGLPDLKLPKLPGLPDFSMPDLSLPDVSMPDVSMPDVSMPDVSMPDVSMPDLSRPDLSMPDLSAPDLSMPDIPAQKQRPKHRWAPHGRIQLKDAMVCQKGKKLIITNATVLQFWDTAKGYEEEKRKKIEVELDEEEQAESWVQTLVFGGATEGEASGCCSIQ
ncbi:hypothetical protein DIPPA_02802 [Diplonema papillatum]|nr:hypothetical protein DIPPA_02802 [Diplonema papillatum]